jgi:carboxylesterase type B
VLQTIFGGLGSVVSPQGEDCLTLNVQRPAGTTSNSKLPVLFYIHGGAFEAGTAQRFDGSEIIQKSTALGEPILYVTAEYRLSAFGFLPRKELQEDGSTNLGLCDQRAALRWVQENIGAFGSDPSKVTIWGESTGSWSVFDQLLIDGGDNSHGCGTLFRAAIMDSGMAYPASSVSSKSAQQVYDAVVAAAGCSGRKDTLECLRSVPYETFLNAANSQPSAFSYQSLDLFYFPRPDSESYLYSMNPYQALAKGTYAKVPLISRNQEDEGTLFSLIPSNVTTTNQAITYFKSWFKTASRDTIAGLVATYPEDPAAGSPFRTGQLNALTPEFKRVAALMGDFCFTLARRVALSAARHPAVYSYLSTYYYGTPVVGTAHGTENYLQFNSFGPPVPVDAILNYYISFVTELDPNALSKTLLQWPKYNRKRPEILHSAQRTPS